MIYIKSLVLSPNTAKETPEPVTIKLSSCILTKVAVEFPRGCYWLVGVRVFLAKHQLYPTSPDEWLVSDGQLITFEDNTIVDSVGYNLTIEGYNLDEYYTHTIRFYLDAVETSGRVYRPTVLVPAAAYMGV